MNNNWGGAKSRYTPLQIAEMIAMRDAGHSWGDIAKHFGCNHTTVMHHYNNQRLEYREKRNRRLALAARKRNGHRTRRPYLSRSKGARLIKIVQVPPIVVSHPVVPVPKPRGKYDDLFDDENRLCEGMNYKQYVARNKRFKTRDLKVGAARLKRLKRKKRGKVRVIRLN